MSEANRKVVLITGAAPYLGGVSTWRPLREAAPEYHFVDLDLLQVRANGDFFAEAQAAIKRVISGDACAVVVHGAAAALVLTAIAGSGVRIPMLLLSPLLVTEDSLRLRIFRALARGPLRGLLVSVARSKQARLLNDSEYVRKQMALMVRGDAITADLLHEAQERIASPHTEATLERTPQTLIHILTPTDAARHSTEKRCTGSPRWT